MKTKTARTTAQAKILIVDDDPQILELFSALLQKAGYKVEKAEHALAAVAAVVRSAPDLILADIRMPIVDGKELAHELKSHNDSRDIPVIAVTGYDAPGSREAALEAGYDGYLTKPIDAKKFAEQVGEFLASAKKKKH
jgi:CheY-like chemotaxis protein